MAHGPATMASPGTADGGCGSRETNDRIVLLDVAADQFVRLRNLDHFLHAGHLFQRALLDFALVAGDADGGALRARHGVGAISQLLNFLTNGAHLLFRGLRLHDD